MTNIAPIGSASLGRVASIDDSTARGSMRGDEAPTRRSGDRAEISEMASYLNKLRALPAVRQDLVDRVRDKIAAGEYDTADKIEQALDELYRDLPG